MNMPFPPSQSERRSARAAQAGRRTQHSRNRQAHGRQQILLFVLLFMFGIILMSHVQSVDAQNTRVGLAELYKTRQAELQQYEQQNQKLQQENSRLLEAKARTIENVLNDTGNSDQLALLERYKVLAGMSEVRGRGVSLTLMDKPGYDNINDPLDAIVHDADMRYAFKLLIENGAAGISVNGMRFVNTSSIVCIGPTILVNENRLAPPYVIIATGDQQRMLQAIAGDPYFALRGQAPTGIVVQSKALESVTLPAYHNADQLEKYMNLLEVTKP